MTNHRYHSLWTACFVITCVGCVLVFAPAMSHCAAQQDETDKSKLGELPSAQQVMDRYVNALGGYEILESVGTTHSVSRGHSGSGKFTYETYRGHGKSRSKYTYDEGNTTERGLADGVGWEIISEGVIREMDAGELEDFMHKNRYTLKAPYWSEMYKTAELDGVERVGDAACYKIKLTRDNDEVTFKHFDIASGLLVRSESKEVFSSTSYQVIREYEDYRMVGEINVSFKQTIRFSDSVFVFNTQVEEFDKHVPESTFQLPPSMAEIAKRKKVEAKVKAAADAAQAKEAAAAQKQTEGDENADSEDGGNCESDIKSKI